MRDRLIELLEEAKIQARATIGSLNHGFGEWYADYLIANGVIVPPVKVGDKIYQTDGVCVYENEVCEISLSKRTVIYYTESAVAFDETAIGKSVFLTREEAEQSLKGGAKE